MKQMINDFCSASFELRWSLINIAIFILLLLIIGLVGNFIEIYRTRNERYFSRVYHSYWHIFDPSVSDNLFGLLLSVSYILIAVSAIMIAGYCIASNF